MTTLNYNINNERNNIKTKNFEMFSKNKSYINYIP